MNLPTECSYSCHTQNPAPPECQGNYCSCFCTLNAVSVHPQDSSKWSTLAAYLTVTILNVFLFPTNFLLSSKGSLEILDPTRAKI